MSDMDSCGVFFRCSVSHTCNVPRYVRKWLGIPYLILFGEKFVIGLIDSSGLHPRKPIPFSWSLGGDDEAWLADRG